MLGTAQAALLGASVKDGAAKTLFLMTCDSSIADETGTATITTTNATRETASPLIGAGSLKFSGSGVQSYVSAGRGAFDWSGLATGDIRTLEFFVNYANGAATRAPFYAYGASANVLLVDILAAETVRSRYFDSANVQLASHTSAALTNGSTHHIVCEIHKTASGFDLFTFANGTCVGNTSAATANGMADPATNITFGYFQTSSPLQIMQSGDMMDNFRVSNVSRYVDVYAGGNPTVGVNYFTPPTGSFTLD